MRSQRKPTEASAFSSNCSAPASRGVTLSQRTSARVSSTVSVAAGVSVSGMTGKYRHLAPKRRAPTLIEPAPSQFERKKVFFLG